MADNYTAKDASGTSITFASADAAGVQTVKHTAATADVARVGATTETAATNSTSTAGLNGLLKAILRESMSVAAVTVQTSGEYETVAASATAQVLGSTGAAGDRIEGVLVIPTTTSPGNILLLDNATSITIFAGGATSVSNLVPFFIPLGMNSVSGAWKLTTGAALSCIAVGNFT